MSLWQPIASMVTRQPLIDSKSNSSGITLISLVLSLVFTCPKTLDPKNNRHSQQSLLRSSRRQYLPVYALLSRVNGSRIIKIRTKRLVPFISYAPKRVYMITTKTDRQIERHIYCKIERLTILRIRISPR